MRDRGGGRGKGREGGRVIREGNWSGDRENDERGVRESIDKE